MIKRLSISLCIAVLVIACETMPTDTVTPQFQIQDAVHNDGNAHFFFLPPLVSDPSNRAEFGAGEFDATQPAEVTISLLGGAACGNAIAEYSTETGPGSETIRVPENEEYYIVNWHTDQFALDEGAHYRIRVLVAGTLLGYADVDVVTGGNQLKNVDTEQYIALKDGRTLPIKFRIEEGAGFFNHVPVVAVPFPGALAVEGVPLQFDFPDFTFYDQDCQPLTYTSDASGWLSFDAETRTFSGTPLFDDVGTTTVTVTADDGSGGSASDQFDILVISPSVNNDPWVVVPIPDLVATETVEFMFPIPDYTFDDLDIIFGQTLTYTSDASGWLSFAAETGMFSGTPFFEDVGTITVTVTADDGNGGSVSDQFDIVINPINHVPVVVMPIPDLNATVGVEFSFVFPDNTFDDLDTVFGQTLTYTSDVSGWEWLDFDAESRTFSGTPLIDDVGTITVTVTAGDGNGGSVSDQFDIVISSATGS